MDVHQAIKTKRAIRQFSDTPISKDCIKKIINAGRLAQSAKNMQPWHFIVIQNKMTLQQLSKCGHFADHVSKSQFAVAIVTPPPETRFSVMFDAGQAAAYMQLSAWEQGIGSCLATIYEPEKSKILLGVPSELTIKIVISFGYPANSLQDAPKKKGRRSFSNVTFQEVWATPFS